MKCEQDPNGVGTYEAQALINFDDSITASTLSLHQQYGVFYGDGRYANGTAVKARLGPNAKLLCITVFGATGKEFHVIDCERGDATPGQAEAWVAHQLALGVYRPGVYASLSTWNGGLLANLAKYGYQIKRWLAHYDNVATLPAGYDAKQYANPGPVDHNVALPEFFDVAPPPPPPPVQGGVAKFEGTVDLTTGEWTVTPQPNAGVVFAGPQQIWNAALSLSVGDGGGQWSIMGTPAT